MAGPPPGTTPGATAETNPMNVAPAVQPLPPPPQMGSAGMTDNLAGALSYLLGFITGILFLVLAPYNQNRNIRFHAFQSIFFNIAWVVIWIVITIVSLAFNAIPFLGVFISMVLHVCLWIGWLIVWLYLMFKTYNGQKVVLPVVGPMAEKQAGV
jgi:uncharacterized membrane protein